MGTRRVLCLPWQSAFHGGESSQSGQWRRDIHFFSFPASNLWVYGLDGRGSACFFNCQDMVGKESVQWCASQVRRVLCRFTRDAHVFCADSPMERFLMIGDTPPQAQVLIVGS